MPIRALELAIYKRQSAKRSRLALLGGLEALGAFGATWLYGVIGETGKAFHPIALNWGQVAAIIFFVAWSAAVFILLNHPRFVDFLVETEAELGKVTWPGRSEFVGATAVVIVTTLVMAVCLFLLDALNVRFLEWIRVYAK